MTKTVKYLLAITVVGVISVLFYTKVYTSKVSFEQISPSVGDLTVKVFGIGQVGAKNIYNIGSSTGGKITAIYTDEGQWVKQGQLLVTIDAVDLPIAVDEAKISIKKANAELNAIRKELVSLAAQKDLALLTFNRNKALKEQNLVSQFDYDKAKTDLKVIDAQIGATKAQIVSANVEIDRVKKAAEALAMKLSRYNIYAPIDGYVIEKNAELAQTIAMSQSILTMVSPKTVWVKAYIDERISGDIKIGQRVKISLRSQPDKVFSGQVARIVAQTDAVTQEKEINVSFDDLPIPFYINEQATVNIITQSFNRVIKIPNQYVSYQDNILGVWVNVENKAHFQALTVIGRNEKDIAVKGISEKSIIILPDEHKRALSEGMSIH